VVTEPQFVRGLDLGQRACKDFPCRRVTATPHRTIARRRLVRPLVLTVASVAITLTCWFADIGGVLRSVTSNGKALAKQAHPLPLHSDKLARDVPQRVEDLPVEPLEPVRKLDASELTPKLIRKADEVLFSQYPPIGTVVPIEVDGHVYVGRVETHYHEVGGPKRPWGRHRGITLYSAD